MTKPRIVLLCGVVPWVMVNATGFFLAIFMNLTPKVFGAVMLLITLISVGFAGYAARAKPSTINLPVPPSLRIGKVLGQIYITFLACGIVFGLIGGLIDPWLFPRGQGHKSHHEAGPITPANK